MDKLLPLCRTTNQQSLLTDQILTKHGINLNSIKLSGGKNQRPHRAESLCKRFSKRQTVLTESASAVARHRGAGGGTHRAALDFSLLAADWLSPRPNAERSRFPRHRGSWKFGRSAVSVLLLAELQCFFQGYRVQAFWGPLRARGRPLSPAHPSRRPPAPCVLWQPSKPFVTRPSFPYFSFSIPPPNQSDGFVSSRRCGLRPQTASFESGV